MQNTLASTAPTTSKEDILVVTRTEFQKSDSNPTGKVHLSPTFKYGKKDLDTYVHSLLSDGDYTDQSLIKLLGDARLHELHLISPVRHSSKDDRIEQNLGFSVNVHYNKVVTKELINSFNPVAWTLLRLINLSETNSIILLKAFAKSLDGTSNWVPTESMDSDQQYTENSNSKSTWLSELGEGGSIGMYKPSNAIDCQNVSNGYVDILIISKHDTLINGFKQKMMERLESGEFLVREYYKAIEDEQISTYMDHNALRILHSTLTSSEKVLETISNHLGGKDDTEVSTSLFKESNFGFKDPYYFQEFNVDYLGKEHDHVDKLQLAHVVYGLPTRDPTNSHFSFTSNIADKEFYITLHRDGSHDNVVLYPAKRTLKNDPQEIAVALLLETPQQLSTNYGTNKKTLAKIGLPIVLAESTKETTGQNLIRALHPYLNGVNILDCVVGDPVAVNYY